MVRKSESRFSGKIMPEQEHGNEACSRGWACGNGAGNALLRMMSGR
jgi:hypothetical protein